MCSDFLYKNTLESHSSIRQHCLKNIFFASFCVKKLAIRQDYSLFCLEIHQKILFLRCMAVLNIEFYDSDKK